ncbi:hypothetical protein GJ744_004493 [Endocarpon pusillum]|uniref:Uncharacterized protein n=1 Tax=Endocarpon pusillum TaxID=364733 RepID=A0A8H7EAE0_9EURO|nr:hypothetical protein GJ744_004493 [Endocarpon pusillum]
MPARSSSSPVPPKVLGNPLLSRLPRAAPRSKGAIEQMTRMLCKDLCKKAFVNPVAPGPNGTELFYKGKSEQVLKMAAVFSSHNRIWTPNEVAQTIVFLSSAPWISGQVVRANGGMA